MKLFLALLATGASASPTAALQPEALTCSACEDDAWTRTVAAGHDAGEPINEVDVVVSFCKHDLAWLHEYIEGLRDLGAPVRNVGKKSSPHLLVTIHENEMDLREEMASVALMHAKVEHLRNAPRSYCCAMTPKRAAASAACRASASMSP